MHDKCFPPIADAHARVLILGSLPGQVSLQRQQYYAHPHNAFWKIMGRLFGAGPELVYAERTQRLIENGIALWDVCASAQRPGSLDAAIVHSSVVPNAFAAFIESHPDIGLICFNGGKAAELYRRQVLPGLPAAAQAIRTATLPSTSPAHAAMPFEEKLTRWAALLQTSH
ncbi:MAG TPA: DNA-deoxyinosine glycosylase [Thiobacillus sp.]|nr:MAG: DNA-deoxyinosine glycosylase [Hydrogenophilales bacterium 28-61-11]OYZ57320.1 MAG: DNA-deoxyinosine glycosylase [Hydrogenophilales bacterium 16-61-112]OZA50382.1 MAG: DNA-deoxyinosine glycosylase [Hydrogenophilales bacterium 17-61-76]HQT31763.1 DNA-deoxyinosine glycosylase [Thiobacillus sp.]HQT70303.1 DNA-deoxyinosine glycosylase [Thiobacillus sp.]